jgi:oxygen-independent coproporphyrinogen-3 oxidase
MLPLTTSPFYHAESIPVNEDDAQVLRDRQRKPQRHRLLHGYALAAAMPRRDAAYLAKDVFFDPHADRDLVVGVLPHPFCNPAVTGCGFCRTPSGCEGAGAVGK